LATKHSIPDISIKTLSVFLEVYREQNVSRAASSLGISQPAISMTLNKLRDSIGDPLFIRSHTGMRPTPRADEFATFVAASLELLERGFLPSEFSAETSKRTFHVGMTEITQSMMLPDLLERLKAEGPQISLNVIRIEEGSLQMLEMGQLDCMVGYFPEMPAGLYEQTLLDRDFVCIASKNHPRLKSAVITLGQFFEEKHVSTASYGSGTVLADAVIDATERRRGIKVMVGDLHAVHMVVASSEFIATIARPVARLFAEAGKINLFEHPVTLPLYPVKLLWHTRYNYDPGSLWFRRVVADAFKRRGREPKI
jgi:DNA-binding transcriptional LysR family regulator